MRSARPTISPACGPPTSLSPLNVTRSAPAASRSAGRRLVGQPEGRGVEQRAAAEVVDDDRAVLVGEPRELDRIGRLDEAGLREVRRMDAQDDGRPPVGERRLEVGGAGPVRRPDLDEPRAGPADDLRDPDAAADLDELAARDGDAAPAGQPDRERQRRGVVVRDERVLGAGQRDRGGPRRPGTAARAARRRGRARAASSRRPRAPAASIAAAGQGARPRLVWRMTPVALMTVVRPLAAGSAKPSSRSRTVVGQRVERPSAARRPRGGARSSATTSRATAVSASGSARPRQLRADRREQPLDARGTRAIRRHRPSVAGTRGSRTHRAAPSAAPLVLKTRGPTGTRPLPSRW